MNNKLFSKIFMWMAIGLLVTFATGLFIANNPNMLANVFQGVGYIVFVIVELVLVIFLASRIFKMQPTTAKISFLLYSFVSGITFSSIFVYYDLSSIIYVFLFAAILFSVLAFVGYTTKYDLSKLGNICLIGLIVCIILSLINIFIGNNTFNLILTIISIIIFLGLTAYDMKKIKNLDNLGLPIDNLAIYGALELYLDFINIFLDLLQLFGKNDN